MKKTKDKVIQEIEAGVIPRIVFVDPGDKYGVAYFEDGKLVDAMCGKLYRDDDKNLVDFIQSYELVPANVVILYEYNPFGIGKRGLWGAGYNCGCILRTFWADKKMCVPVAPASWKAALLGKGNGHATEEKVRWYVRNHIEGAAKLLEENNDNQDLIAAIAGGAGWQKAVGIWKGHCNGPEDTRTSEETIS